jgi:murein DD-endopeptidase MepM/ murein hydrolase activator NlpD
MNKLGWSFVLVTSKSVSKVRQFRIPAFVAILIGVITFAGMAGLIRLVAFSTSYSIAKFGSYEAKRENDGLSLKIKFLSRFILKQSDKLKDLVRFEDKVRLQYGMNRISSDVRLAGVGGRPLSEEMLIAKLLDPMLVRAESVKDSLEVLLRQAELQESTLTQVTSNLDRLQRVWCQRPSIWPTDGRLTSTFGWRLHPVLGINMFHEGLDIANKAWTPVYATADGKVKFRGVRDDYGNAIILQHGNNLETLYGHLNKILISQGDIVRRGQLIGYMGNTGRSTGPHLHYEVHIDGRLANPLSYILPADIIID